MHISDVPQPLLAHIFTFLPASSYSTADECWHASSHYGVCQQWRELLDRPAQPGQWTPRQLIRQRNNELRAHVQASHTHVHPHSHAHPHSRTHSRSHSRLDTTTSAHEHYASEQVSASTPLPWHDRCMQIISQLCGHPAAFVLSCAITVLWAAVGPAEQYSSTWLLWINSISTIVAYWIVFILQNAKNRHMSEVHDLLHDLVHTQTAVAAALLADVSQGTRRSPSPSGVELTITSRHQHELRKQVAKPRSAQVIDVADESVHLHEAATNTATTLSARIMLKFSWFAHWTARASGSHWTFALLCLLCVLWLACGPSSGWSDMWQLVWNAATSVAILLIVFVIMFEEMAEMHALTNQLQQLSVQQHQEQNTPAHSHQHSHNADTRRPSDADKELALVELAVMSPVADADVKDTVLGIDKPLELPLERQNSTAALIKHNVPVLDSSNDVSVQTLPASHASSRFEALADYTARIVGHGYSFFAVVVSVIVWACFGPSMQFSDTWWLIVNTMTTIITYLVLFPIQNTELRRRHMTLQHTKQLAHIKGRVRLLRNGSSASDLADINNDAVDAKQVPASFMERVNTTFQAFANRCSEIVGSSLSFVIGILSIVAWAISGPFIGFNDTWQLIVNTATMSLQLFFFILLQSSMNESTRNINHQLQLARQAE